MLNDLIEKKNRELCFASNTKIAHQKSICIGIQLGETGTDLYLEKKLMSFYDWES